MHFNILLIAAGFASTALAESYNYARGFDLSASSDELLERDVYADEQNEVAQFIRSLDDDEIEALFRRGLGGAAKKIAAKVTKKVKSAGHSLKGNAKGAVSRVTPIKFKNQVKPVKGGRRLSVSRRGLGGTAKKIAAKVTKKVKSAGHSLKGNAKGTVSRVTPIKFKNQVKPVKGGRRLSVS